MQFLKELFSLHFAKSFILWDSPINFILLGIQRNLLPKTTLLLTLLENQLREQIFQKLFMLTLMKAISLLLLKKRMLVFLIQISSIHRQHSITGKNQFF